MTVRRWACNSLCTRVLFVISWASSADWTSLTVRVNSDISGALAALPDEGGGGGGVMGEN